MSIRFYVFWQLCSFAAEKNYLILFNANINYFFSMSWLKKKCSNISKKRVFLREIVITRFYSHRVAHGSNLRTAAPNLAK